MMTSQDRSDDNQTYDPEGGGDAEILSSNIRLILGRTKDILERPKWYWCTPPCIYFERAFLGIHRPPLGILLEMWNRGRMTIKYAGYSEKLLVFASAGSPMSGSGWFRAICVETGQIIRGETDGNPDVADGTSTELTGDFLDVRKSLSGMARPEGEVMTLQELIAELKLLY